MLEQRLDAILGPAISHEDDGNDTEERFSDTAVTAKELLDLADRAAGIGDLRQARAEAARRTDNAERLEDEQHASRTREYSDLHAEVESSLTLLTSLESFISTFQNDLSAVSGHISDLQGRSKVLEARLDNRKAVRSSLNPLLSSITVSPQLIDLLMDTEPSEAWLDPIAELETILLAVRGGPRSEPRHDLEEVVEKLRIRAMGALRTFLINLFTPYRTSIAPNLTILQTSILVKYRPFFAFLQRHAARAAHEVQKAYVSTAQWYYETGFRRYVRALERIRLRSVAKEDPIGVIGGAETPLSLLSRRSIASASLDTPRASLDASASAPEHPRPESTAVILAYMAEDPNFKAPTEMLFRSIALVLADNARSEYAFISTFFGRPEDLSHPLTNEKISVTLARSLGAGLGRPDISSSQMSSAHDDDSASVLSDGQSFATHNNSLAPGSGKRSDRARHHVAETVWKQVFEPNLEYAKNFVTTLLTQSSPGCLSILSMIRLNDSLTEQLTARSSGSCPTQAMESYLISLKLQMWPLFQKELGNHIDSVKKLAESGNASGMAGMLGGKGTGVKDSVVAAVAKRYAHFFGAIVALSQDQEDDMVFNSLLRLRNEVQKLVTGQAARLSEPSKSKAYLKNQYEQLLQSLMTDATSHPRMQAEIAYWREALRRA